jgi:GGDEF domain-containing protein
LIFYAGLVAMNSLLFLPITVENAMPIWERIEDNIKKFNGNSNLNYDISLSHGFSEYCPGDNRTLDELIESADKEMYKLKRLMKNIH